MPPYGSTRWFDLLGGCPDNQPSFFACPDGFMKRIFLLLAVAGFCYVMSTSTKVQSLVQQWSTPLQSAASSSTSLAVTKPTRAAFNCDGRQYCSQMTSCTEAKSFLQNCPGMKMDGNGDGIPCEMQWCK